MKSIFCPLEAIDPVLARLKEVKEKEEKLKEHIRQYVALLLAERVPLELHESMIRNETERFQQILENE
jgi:hypothetical protein